MKQPSLFAIVLSASMPFLMGCRTETPSVGPYIGEHLPPDPACRTALERAVERVASIDWLNLTKRRYKVVLSGYNKKEDVYSFSFVFTDTPDQAVLVRVTPQEVSLEGKWVPPP